MTACDGGRMATTHIIRIATLSSSRRRERPARLRAPRYLHRVSSYPRQRQTSVAQRARTTELDGRDERRIARRTGRPRSEAAFPGERYSPGDVAAWFIWTRRPEGVAAGASTREPSRRASGARRHARHARSRPPARSGTSTRVAGSRCRSGTGRAGCCSLKLVTAKRRQRSAAAVRAAGRAGSASTGRRGLPTMTVAGLQLPTTTTTTDRSTLVRAARARTSRLRRTRTAERFRTTSTTTGNSSCAGWFASGRRRRPPQPTRTSTAASTTGRALAKRTT